MESIESLVDDEIRELIQKLKISRELDNYEVYTTLTNALMKLITVKNNMYK